MKSDYLQFQQLTLIFFLRILLSPLELVFLFAVPQNKADKIWKGFKSPGTTDNKIYKSKLLLYAYRLQYKEYF